MRKEEQLGLVVDALTLMRAMQERLTPQEGLSNVSLDLSEAINRLEAFLSRTDKFHVGWWDEFRVILEMVLTVLRIYFDFLR